MMKSIHLILPPFPFQRKEKILPLNLGYLSAVAPSDFDLEVLDADLAELSPMDFTRRVADLDSAALLFTSHTYQIHFVARAAEAAKSLNRDVLTVVGGPHVSQLPEETLRRYRDIDIAVIGEGEHTLVEILDSLRRDKDFHPIEGVVFREDGGLIRTPQREMIQDLDSLPMPAWEYFDVEQYSSFYPLKTTSIPILTSRGCPYKCNFCNRALGDTARFRSLASIYEELDRAISKGHRAFAFPDETFTMKRDRVILLCEHLIGQRSEKAIEWVTQTRVDLIDEELVALMGSAGCAAINFGMESGDQGVLDSLGKGITLDQITRTMEICRKAKVQVLANMILGSAVETPETLRATRRLVFLLKPDRLAVNQLIAFPGTEIHRMAERGEQGMQLLHDDWELYHPQMKTNLKVPGVTQRKIIWFQFTMYFRFYLMRSNQKTLLPLLHPRTLWQYLFRVIRTMLYRNS